MTDDPDDLELADLTPEQKALLAQFPKPPPEPPTMDDPDSVDKARYSAHWAERFVVPFMKDKYANREEALARAEVVVPLRGARMIRMFETGRAYVAECVPVNK